MSPATMRMVLVFPAASGPVKPYSSPRATSNDTPRTAWVAPKRRDRSRARITPLCVTCWMPGMSALRPGQRHLNRHAGPQLVIGVIDAHLDREHQPIAIGARLDVARRELG